MYRCKIVKEPKLDLDDIDRIFSLRQINQGLAVSIIDAEPRYLIRIPQFIVKANGKAALYVKNKLGIVSTDSSTSTRAVTTETTSVEKTTETPIVTSEGYKSTQKVTTVTTLDTTNSTPPPSDGKVTYMINF